MNRGRSTMCRFKSALLYQKLAIIIAMWIFYTIEARSLLISGIETLKLAQAAITSIAERSV